MFNDRDFVHESYKCDDDIALLQGVLVLIKEFYKLFKEFLLYVVIILVLPRWVIASFIVISLVTVLVYFAIERKIKQMEMRRDI